MATTYDHTSAGLNKMTKTVQEEKLIKCDVLKESYFFSRIKKKAWNCMSRYDIPWEVSKGGSVAFGCYPEKDQIFKGLYEKGYVDKGAELLGSLCVSEKDLYVHRDINKFSYLKLIGDQAKGLKESMKSIVDSMFVTGSITSIIPNPVKIGTNDAGTITAGDANGVTGAFFVSRPECLKIGQYIEILDKDNTLVVQGYVGEVDFELSQVILSSTMPNSTGYTAVTVAALDTAGAQAPYKIVPRGYAAEIANGNSICSLEDLAFGGASIHNVNRSAAPFLKGQFFDVSSTITAANALSTVYKLYYKIKGRMLGTKNDEVHVPLGLFYILADELQNHKDYHNKDMEAKYGFTGIEMIGPMGSMKIMANPYLNPMEAWIIDYDHLMWLGDTEAKVNKDLGASEWYVERTNKGKVYIKDMALRGKFATTKPLAFTKINIGTDFLQC